MKNQTKEEYKQSGKLGVGLVVKKEGEGYRKHILHNKTYEEIVEIGDEHEGYKFFPYGIELLLWGEMRRLDNADSIPDELFMCGGGRCSTKATETKE